MVSKFFIIIVTLFLYLNGPNLINVDLYRSQIYNAKTAIISGKKNEHMIVLHFDSTNEILEKGLRFFF